MQEQLIFPKNSKCAPDKKICGHFCPRRKAANFCHPAYRVGHYGTANNQLLVNLVIFDIVTNNQSNNLPNRVIIGQ